MYLSAIHIYDSLLMYICVYLYKKKAYLLFVNSI